MKKRRRPISTKSAFKNLLFRMRTNDGRAVGIHFGSPEQIVGSISSHVPDSTSGDWVSDGCIRPGNLLFQLAVRLAKLQE